MHVCHTDGSLIQLSYQCWYSASGQTLDTKKVYYRLSAGHCLVTWYIQLLYVHEKKSNWKTETWIWCYVTCIWFKKMDRPDNRHLTDTLGVSLLVIFFKEK